MTFAWTDSRLDFIKARWTEGLSASQIAALIEVGRNEQRPSRSAICGKLFRMGEARVGAPVKGLHERRTKPRKAYSEITHQFRKSLEPVPIVMKPRRPKSESQMPNEPPSLDFTLFQLTNGTCHWPRGEEAPFRFCAQPTLDTLPYCDFHAHVAYPNLP